MAGNFFTRQRPAVYRRYTRRMMLASVVYVGAIMLASRMLHHHAPPTPLAVGIALLPGLAVLGMLAAVARLIIELEDEYLRMLEVRKALVATGFMLAVCSVWGLLEIFTDVPKLPLFWAFPIWAMGLFVGMIVNKLTLGDGGCV